MPRSAPQGGDGEGEGKALALGHEDLARALQLTLIICDTFRPAGDRMRPWLSRSNNKISDLMSNCHVCSSDPAQCVIPVEMRN